jgi:DNA-binding XRE family transcriptional regulator
VSRGRSVRARLAPLFPRGHPIRLGPLSIRRQRDGLLIGPSSAHPTYGDAYQQEPLPPRLTLEQLREYAGRMSWYHEIDLGNGVLTPGMKSRGDITREWDLFALDDLTGRSVLDIGDIDGAYAFRAEQAGASPVAVLDHYLWSLTPNVTGASTTNTSTQEPLHQHQTRAMHGTRTPRQLAGASMLPPHVSGLSLIYASLASRMADQSWASTVARARQIRHTLANNVRRERERAGLSQEALADACKLRRGAIARIEKAEREPRVSTLVACSIALDVPLRVFLQGLPEGADTHP